MNRCCGHLSKNYSKDVNEYFPKLNKQNQTVLKEIFAGMFDLESLNTLLDIWKKISTILLSKYQDENVVESTRIVKNNGC